MTKRGTNSIDYAVEILEREAKKSLHLATSSNSKSTERWNALDAHCARYGKEVMQSAAQKVLTRNPIIVLNCLSANFHQMLLASRQPNEVDQDIECQIAYICAPPRWLAGYWHLDFQQSQDLVGIKSRDLEKGSPLL